LAADLDHERVDSNFRQLSRDFVRDVTQGAFNRFTRPVLNVTGQSASVRGTRANANLSDLLYLGCSGRSRVRSNGRWLLLKAGTTANDQKYQQKAGRDAKLNPGNFQRV
jgi:hypothetical protein